MGFFDFAQTANIGKTVYYILFIIVPRFKLAFQWHTRVLLQSVILQTRWDYFQASCRILNILIIEGLTVQQ